MGTLDWIEVDGTGWLAVREVDTAWDRPVRVTTWWPVARMTWERAKDWTPLGTEVRETRPGVYQYRTGWASDVTVYLADEGKTRPIKREEVEIPPPRVGKGTKLRWQSGHWEKATRTKGWRYA